MTTEAELAWAAGLFDGEGYASVVPKGNTKQPLMVLSMTHFGAVEKFQALFGVGHLLKEEPRQAHHKPALRWTARSRLALFVAEQLLPFSVVKADALKKILDHYAAYEPPKHLYVAGSVGPTALLTGDDVRAIRTSTEPGKVLAEKYGVTVFQISRVRTRKSWAHVED